MTHGTDIQSGKIIDELLIAGTQCSNVCFNAAQRPLDEYGKASARESAARWDKAVAAAHETREESPRSENATHVY